MSDTEYFYLEESPIQVGKFLITPRHDKFFLKSTTGSYNIICARLLNLSYAQYLRFCRDICKAEIIGKNCMYPVAYFQRSAVVAQLVKLLNKRAKSVLWEREHPNWREHLQELQELTKKNEVDLNGFNTADTQTE